MDEITTLLHKALDDEPPNPIHASAVLIVGRRAQRRQRAAVACSAAGIGVVALGVAFALAPGDTDSRPADRTAASRVTPASASASPSPTVRSSSASAAVGSSGGITAASLPGQVERGADITLSNVDVGVLQPVSDINLAASIASAKGQYLNVQVTPPGTEPVVRPRCADLEGSGANGDLYTGACSVRAMPDGGYLVLRSGRTSDGRFAMSQATLLSGDGAGITAEATNQSFEPGKRRIAPVVSHDPPLTSAQLRQLVLTLQTQR